MLTAEKIKVCQSHLENCVKCGIKDWKWAKYYWNCETKEYMFNRCKLMQREVD